MFVFQVNGAVKKVIIKMVPKVMVKKSDAQSEGSKIFRTRRGI